MLVYCRAFAISVRLEVEYTFVMYVRIELGPEKLWTNGYIVQITGWNQIGSIVGAGGQKETYYLWIQYFASLFKKLKYIYTFIYTLSYILKATTCFNFYATYGTAITKK